MAQKLRSQGQSRSAQRTEASVVAIAKAKAANIAAGKLRRGLVSKAKYHHHHHPIVVAIAIITTITSINTIIFTTLINTITITATSTTIIITTGVFLKV